MILLHQISNIVSCITFLGSLLFFCPLNGMFYVIKHISYVVRLKEVKSESDVSLGINIIHNNQ